ncbi:hypothetical protein CSKR_105524 [Clonorchis sinensis]|uniref:Uncharacterized protein n=1 Tax=Clonorchis sinensis TaxID=79923 RepID=A0A3R7D4L7_CLOSI|nr:hypothetical protein CSKR_105524 [Clonorchis sinensis]
MLQRDSTNSVTDLTFQETQSGFTRRRATHMPHQIFKCETSIPNSDSNKTHKHSRLDAKPHENVKRRTPKMRNAMTAKSTKSGTGCFSGTRDSAGFQVSLPSKPNCYANECISLK